MHNSKEELLAKCAVIIVTHNSRLHIEKCMRCLFLQSKPPSQIVLVDSGSSDLDYLQDYAHHPPVILYAAGSNIGFCRGNNIGLSLVREEVKYVLFLNPDVFIQPELIEQSIEYMEKDAQKNTAAISGLLLGYDIHKDKPTGMIDSSGVFRTWYGRWYDRSQGEYYHTQKEYKEECVPALCGAMFFARRKALNEVFLRPNELLDNSFFMYKDDIDLSLRLRKKGWHLKFLPKLNAYHCRGWNKDRQMVARRQRLLSAKNEIRLFIRFRSPCFIYSTIKYLCVKWFDV